MFYPYENGGGGGGGAEKVLAMLKVGPNSFGVVFTPKLEVLAILKGGGGGTKSFNSLKGGGTNSFTVLSWGAQKVLDPRFSHFAPPPPLPHN